MSASPVRFRFCSESYAPIDVSNDKTVRYWEYETQSGGTRLTGVVYGSAASLQVYLDKTYCWRATYKIRMYTCPHLD